MAECRIHDSGIGIPEADRERMFQAFHRGRNASHLPGTGLGLTIVQRCVEVHRGRLTVESEVGRGTTMTVHLPLFPQTAEPANPGSGAGAARPRPATAEAYTI